MIVIFLVLVILGLLAALAYPLVTGSSSEEEETPQDPYLEELLSKKEATYSALKELEFDYGTGKLSEEDYAELRGEYKAKAVAILREIDEAEEGDSIDSQIEHAVEELRAGARKPKRAATVAETVCAQCGVSNDLGDKYCSGCGEPLAEQSRRNVCRKCGLDYQKGDKFCSGCGEALVAVRG